jgi:hypothetical protein
LRNCPGYAGRVGCPAVQRAWRQVGDVELHRLIERAGEDAHVAVGAGPEGDGDLQVDRDGQHDAVVVIDVAADQVHPARRPAQELGTLLERALEGHPGQLEAGSCFAGVCR